MPRPKREGEEAVRFRSQNGSVVESFEKPVLVSRGLCLDRVERGKRPFVSGLITALLKNRSESRTLTSHRETLHERYIIFFLLQFSHLSLII